MASTVDIKQLMLDHDLSEKEIAAVLFPENKYPELSFRRILAGEQNLLVEQISALASYLGVPVYSLFTEKGWYDCPAKENVLYLRKGDVSAILRYGGQDLVIRDRAVGTQRIMMIPELVSVAELIEIIDKELAKDLL